MIAAANLPPRRDRQLTPHHAGRREISTGRGTLVVLDTGDPAGGDTRSGGPVAPLTIIMLPGYTGAKEDFAPLLDPLSENGFRVIAVDLPGQHESPGSDRESSYSVEESGAVIHALISSLGGEVVLLGHSFGGLLARAAVLAGARIRGLVLLSSGPAALPPGIRAKLIAAGEPMMRAHGPAATWELQQRMIAANSGEEELVLDDLQEYFRRRFTSSTTAGLLGMGAALLAEPDRVAELATELDRRGTPVLVVSGEADDAWGLDLQAGMAQRLGTSLILIPGAAHSAAVENPDALLRVLLHHLRLWFPAPSSRP